MEKSLSTTIKFLIKYFSQFPLKPDLSDFTAQFNFKSDLNYFDGDLIKNNLD